MQAADPRNTIEQVKAEKDGLDLLPEFRRGAPRPDGARRSGL